MRTATSEPANRRRGATLLEVLIAMLVISLVATGIITAFIFSRRMSWRSGTELSGASLVQEIAEQLRAAVGVVQGTPPDTLPDTLPNGLTLRPGIYVDEHMDDNGGFIPAGATQLAALNLWNSPTDPFKRFQVDKGTAATIAGHGDGRLVVVEDADHPAAVPPTVAVDLDNDGSKGISFDGTTTALRRVRIRVKWTSPTT